MKYYWKDTTTKCFEDEIWKDITEWKGLYQVSNKGRVKSLDRIIECNANRYSIPVRRKTKGRILKQKINKYGYLVLMLQNKGYKKDYSVHRLVLETFCPIENMNSLTVNHTDGLKQLNIPEQLEWATNKEQTEHAYEIGLISYDNITRGENIGVSKLTNKIVKELYKNLDNLDYTELSKKYNISEGNISLIMNDMAWQHITKYLTKNKIVKYLTKEDVVFIFTNPLNLDNGELSLLFNKKSNAIRRIFKRERQSKHTENLISNEIKSFSHYFYRAILNNDVFYFTDINKFIEDKECIVKSSLMSSIRENKKYKGWEVGHCSKEEYKIYLEKIYKVYIQSKNK